MPSKAEKFLAMVQNELKNSEIEFRVVKRRIDKNFEYNGYFDEQNRELVVMKDEFFLDVLVHEYAHYIQYKEKHPSFMAYYRPETDPILLTEQWLSRKVSYSDKVQRAFSIIRTNEYECDRLAVKLIKQHSLPINLSKYIKMANRAILFYHFVEKSRNWSPTEEFHSAESLKDVPARFQKSYITHIPKRFMYMLSYFQETSNV